MKLKAREFDPRTIPSTMGCRTYSGWDINWRDDFERVVKEIADGKNVGVLRPMSSSHMKDGRGNIAPATIILPTIAMEAKKKAEKNNDLEHIVDYFMKELDKAILDCKNELLERFDWICSQDKAAAEFMYKNSTFYSYNSDFEKEGIRGALKHGTLAVGQLGLAECLQLLIGCDHTTKKGMELAKKIEQLFYDRCKEFKEEWHYAKISKEQVCSEMIKKIEEQEKRKLSDEEKKEIVAFCESKKI